ncbi:MAG TPA: hypothetical protein VK171_04540 [Fimbriimonas sp.]|nr:hypothetical protein [Fimbriimonas sp.]
MPFKTEQVNISQDDKLWVVSKVSYEPPPSGANVSIRQLLEDPNVFTANTGIKINFDGQEVTPHVTSPYIYQFRPGSGPVREGFRVQGIHNTSVLTISMPPRAPFDIQGDPSAPQRIPLDSRIELTLVQNQPDLGVVPNSGLAYLHYEINPDRHSNLTPQQLAEHVTALLQEPDSFEADYGVRFSGNGINVEVREQDADGHPVNIISGQNKSITFRPEREVFVQSHASPEPGTVVLSCNIDIGTYYVDSLNNIVIVIDQSVIKLYL